ncbi:hypothetical protein PSHT_09955 [Puccinia striiformis]|uniref:Uncharacterized protein n=1 Tax=Puccinia striiformis TaxID=27350 RepID=A0A2S4VD12_9BASI|nr:hypothetical protein PSHT_09955 [Puccinia striiformis]
MFCVHRLHISDIQVILSGRPTVKSSVHVRIRLQTLRILWSHCARGNDVVRAGHIASLGWADHATSMPIGTSDQLLRTKLEIDLDIDESNGTVVIRSETDRFLVPGAK